MLVAALGGASALHQYRGGGAPSCSANAPPGELLVEPAAIAERLHFGCRTSWRWHRRGSRRAGRRHLAAETPSRWEGRAARPPDGAAGSAYLAERDDAPTPLLGALCDEWERHDAAGRTIVGFHFYMLQADIVPTGDVAEAEQGGASAAGEPAYGEVRKRLVRAFSCEERA